MAPKTRIRACKFVPDESQVMERWYNTLRQSSARFVRKTLSFSKSDTYHEIVVRLFVIQHYLVLQHHKAKNNVDSPFQTG